MPSRKAITRQQAVIMAVATIIAAAVGIYIVIRPGPASIPGEFELSGLVIDPTEIDEGDSVVISVDIKNFPAEVKALHKFRRHFFWVNFFNGYSASCDECFL